MSVCVCVGLWLKFEVIFFDLAVDGGFADIQEHRRNFAVSRAFCQRILNCLFFVPGQSAAGGFLMRL